MKFEVISFESFLSQTSFLFRYLTYSEKNGEIMMKFVISYFGSYRRVTLQIRYTIRKQPQPTKLTFVGTIIILGVFKKVPNFYNFDTGNCSLLNGIPCTFTNRKDQTQFLNCISVPYLYLERFSLNSILIECTQERCYNKKS